MAKKVEVLTPGRPAPEAPQSEAELADLHKRVGEVLRYIKAAEAEKGRLDDTIHKQEAEAARLCESIYLYATKHRPEFEKKNVVVANAGSFGWKDSTRLVIATTVERVVKWLLKNKHKSALRFSDPTLNKKYLHDKPELVKKIPGASLEKVELFKVHALGQEDHYEKDSLTGEWVRRVAKKKKVPKVLGQVQAAE